jgi:hypothetical protein
MMCELEPTKFQTVSYQWLQLVAQLHRFENSCLTLDQPAMSSAVSCSAAAPGALMLTRFTARPWEAIYSSIWQQQQKQQQQQQQKQQQQKQQE